MIQIPNVPARLIVDQLKAEDGWLDAVVMNLYKNNYAPGATSVLADFTPADFVGYAASSVIEWGTTYSDILNKAVTVGDIKQFTCTASTTPNLIYGYYITASGVLRYAEKFPMPIPVVNVADAVIVMPIFSFSGST